MHTLSFLLFFAVATPTATDFPAPPASTLTVAAADPLLVSTYPKQHQLTLRLANLQQQRTTITLEEMNGTAVCRRSVRDHNGFAVTFDMEALDNGRYVLVVKKGDTVRKQVIRKDEDGVRCSDWL